MSDIEVKDLNGSPDLSEESMSELCGGTKYIKIVRLADQKVSPVNQDWTSSRWSWGLTSTPTLESTDLSINLK